MNLVVTVAFDELVLEYSGRVAGGVGIDVYVDLTQPGCECRAYFGTPVDPGTKEVVIPMVLKPSSGGHLPAGTANLEVTVNAPSSMFIDNGRAASAAAGAVQASVEA